MTDPKKVETERQEKLLSGLLKIGRELATKRDAASLMNALLDGMLESFGAERGFLLLKDDNGKFIPSASRLMETQVHELGEASRTALQEAIDKGEPVVAEDAQQDPRFAGSSSIIMHDIRSIGVTPLKLGDEIIGALYMDSRLGENAFSDQSSSILSLFGALAAQTIDQAQTLATLHDENVRLRRQAGRFAFEEIIGTSKAMEQVFALMERVAPTDLPVLIHGESGTGKELIARAIHNHGPRSEKSFLALFAGNLGEDLLESELFGHAKGSFTGAYQDKDGLLTLANGGTLMLDEIADIPPRVQAKLLRVLQDGVYKPVGGTKNLYADVRIVSATHQDLALEVKENRFREDLYYRINGIEILVPPLRERREDIALIAEKVLRRYCEQIGRGHVRFSKEALSELTRAKWPGNVRELERTVERAVVLCPGTTITPEHLIFTRTADGDEGPEDLSLKGAEKRHILRVLSETQGNRSEAARILGISRRYLQNLVKEWKEEGIDV